MTQYIESCTGDTVRKDYPQAELQKNFASSRMEMLDILTLNPVVTGEVEKECERVLNPGAKSLMGVCRQASCVDSTYAWPVWFYVHPLAQHKPFGLSMN